MKRHLTRKRVAVAACVAAVAAAVSLALILSPGKGTDAPGQAPAGPQEVLSGFYAALASGKTAEARACCDTLSPVMDYIGEFGRNIGGKLIEAGDAASIVPCMIGVKLTREKRSRDLLTVTFILSLEEGAAVVDGSREKARTAQMRQEGGQWKIVGITAE